MACAEILIAVGVLLITFVAKRILFERKNLPPGPAGLPVFGYLPFLTKKPHLKFIELSKKYGSIFSLYLGSELVVVLNDAEEIRDVLSRKELLARPTKSPFYFLGIETPFFSPNFKLWQEQRRFVVQSMKDLGLGKSKVEGHIQDEIQYFINVIEQAKGNPVYLLKPLTPSMSNNICSLVFGERYDYDNPERVLMDHALHDVTSNLTHTSVITFLPWLRYFPFLLSWLKYDKAVESATQLFSLVRRKVKQHKETLDDKNVRDFIDSYLLEAQSRKTVDPETTFTERNLNGIALNLFGAGSEMVRTCISWCMYIMAAFPEIQEKVHNEIDDIIGSGNLPQFPDQKNLPYCQAVIHEVLRWKTVAPLNSLRCVLEDIEIGGLHIPKGTIVIANLYAAHHDPKYWSDPEEFRPNRFLSEDGTVLKQNSFMVFSVGKRSCPGEAMAIMEAFLYFVTILQKFRVSFPKGYTPTFEAELGIALRVKECKLCFSTR